MIGFLKGEVIFSDGIEAIVLTSSGQGLQVYCNYILSEGKSTSLYISHIIRENSEVLYGFITLREKKTFELLNLVKGVGPKSAYTLISTIGANQVIEAISFESKKVLTKAPGIGPKAASQIILDLSKKIKGMKMYTEKPVASGVFLNTENAVEDNEKPDSSIKAHNSILTDTIMACKELGFKEDDILPLAQKIMAAGEIAKAEQLVHLVLREL